jgi:folate-binding protein YgfZ
VQLGDVSATFAALDIVGPESPRAVAALLGVATESIASLAVHGAMRAAYEGEPVIVRRIAEFGGVAVELLVGRDRLAAVESTLAAAGVAPLASEAAEALRIEAGVPQFGRDMDEETIPLEAGIEERAISFTKGCYVGQEVIIRVLHRGHGRVARRLVGLVFDAAAAVAPPGTPLAIDGKEVGQVTSSTFSPSLQRPIALAYLKRDFTAPGTRALTPGGEAAEVAALPFAAR